MQDHQRQERADAGRRQGGQDRDRVDVTFVENAEHDVDDEDRRRDQQRRRFQRGLEGLRGALEGPVDGRRQVELRCNAWIAVTAWPIA